MVQIQVKGIKEVTNFFTNLPKEMDRQISKEADTFMQSTYKSAKLRAPRWTGKLVESIRYSKGKDNQWKIIVQSPYGVFQEFGFTPHYVQLGTSTRSGFVVADWAASKGLKGSKGSIFVSEHKPFIMPALEFQIAKLPMMLSQGTRKAVNKAGRLKK